MKPRSILTLFSTVCATALLLVGCVASDPAANPNPNMPPVKGAIAAELGLEGLSALEVVDRLDTMPIAERPDTITTSITATQVTLGDLEGNTEVIPLPEEQLYVSVAPYLTQTHDCYYHSPTGCIGELQNMDIEVTVKNLDTGDLLIDAPMTTFDNGFVGLWLPRGIEVSIEMTYGGHTALSHLSTTGDDAQTCVTTLQLS